MHTHHSVACLSRNASFLPMVSVTSSLAALSHHHNPYPKASPLTPYFPALLFWRSVDVTGCHCSLCEPDLKLLFLPKRRCSSKFAQACVPCWRSFSFPFCEPLFFFFFYRMHSIPIVCVLRLRASPRRTRETIRVPAYSSGFSLPSPNRAPFRETTLPPLLVDQRPFPLLSVWYAPAGSLGSK